MSMEKMIHRLKGLNIQASPPQFGEWTFTSATRHISMRTRLADNIFPALHLKRGAL